MRPFMHPTKTGHDNHRCIEPLESRTMLSSTYSLASILVDGEASADGGAYSLATAKRAEPAHYELSDLLGFDQVGAAWRYQTAYRLAGDFGSERGVVTTRIRHTGREDSDGVTESTWKVGDATIVARWQTSASGTEIEAVTVKSELGTFRIDLEHTLAAPGAMEVGKVYSDSGTYDGTLRFEGDSLTVTATTAGTARVRSKLVGVRQVTVPAGRFDAVKGTYRVRLNGQFSIPFGGRTYTGTYTAVLNSKFYSAEDIGIIKSRDSLSLKGRAPVFGKFTAKAFSTNKLLSFDPA